MFSIDLDKVLSLGSLGLTIYFWFVKASNERPNLEFFQLMNFRANCRRGQSPEGKKRLCVTMIDTGGVLVVNHSTRQDSVVLFDCFLKTDRGTIQGDWGYTGDDKPPWNVGPQSTIGISPACFFEVPEDYEIPDDLEFKITFYTASGTQFSHTFSKQAPSFRAEAEPLKQAA